MLVRLVMLTRSTLPVMPGILVLFHENYANKGCSIHFSSAHPGKHPVWQRLLFQIYKYLGFICRGIISNNLPGPCRSL